MLEAEGTRRARAASVVAVQDCTANVHVLFESQCVCVCVHVHVHVRVRVRERVRVRVCVCVCVCVYDYTPLHPGVPNRALPGRVGSGAWLGRSESNRGRSMPASATNVFK